MKEYDKSYREGKETIPDSLYDSLLKKEMDKSNEKYEDRSIEVNKGSNKIPHLKKMLSLENIYNAEDLPKRFLNNKVILSPKHDGISVEITYIAGNLANLVSRGNGTKGESLSRHINIITNIPKKVPTHFKAIYGELVIIDSEFKKTAYKNNRNAVIGITRKDKPDTTVKLTFIPFDSLSTDNTYEFKPYNEKLTYLSKLFNINSTYEIIENVNYKSLEASLSHMRSALLTIGHLCDGVVIRLCDQSLFLQQGHTEHHPKGAIAFKYEAAYGIAKLLDIKYTVGRTGAITPVAVLSPTKVKGVTIEHATLYNTDILDRFRLSIGDLVKIERKADVTPYISSIVEKDKSGVILLSIDECPKCGFDLDIATEGIPKKICTNLDCPAKFSRRLEFLCSTKVLNIAIGEKSIEKLVDYGIDNLYKFFTITEEQLNDIGIKGDNAYNIISSIEETKKEIPLEKFIYALGIPKIGMLDILKLLSMFKNLNGILTSNVDTITSIKGIGKKKAYTFLQFFDDKRIDEINKLSKIINITPYKEKSFTGMKVCFTGIFEGNLNRNKLGKLVEELGGYVGGNVTKDTDFLVKGKDPGKTKLDAAYRYKIKIINKKQLLSYVYTKETKLNSNID